jgi:putative DNA methylase
MHPVKTPKKLIEVALPLDSINDASVREKSIRHGHPSTLHLWWARRPLAAARAMLFAQLVNDPGYERSLGRGVNKDKAKVERERLFEIMRRLVQWENTNNAAVIEEARAEIKASWRETCELNRGHPQAAELFNPNVLPGFHDPFAGGGAIPLEAQRLGLKSHATDLNPVAVVINKAMIEMPALFAGMAPVGPMHEGDKQANLTVDWSGARGLAEDVRRYGLWMRDEAFKRIGHLYPKVEVPYRLGGGEATVIAWIWARTVKSPNPAFSHVDVPLISTYILSSKAGREAYVKPVVSGDTYRFEVIEGVATDQARVGTKSGGRGANFICIVSGTPIGGDYIKAEGVAGRMGSRLLAVVADGPRGRLFLAPTDDMEKLAQTAVPQWRPGGEVPARLTGGTCVPYGMKEWGDLFTPRQLVALNTFVDVVQDARAKVRADAIRNGRVDDGKGMNEGGSGATAYADAISVYLAFLIDQVANHSSTICGWNHPNTQLRSVFSRQALPMTWDYAETNVFSTSSGSFNNLFERQIKGFEALGQKPPGLAMQADARNQTVSANKVISTDPPYYDNIAYADLSDFFYVWLRRSLRSVFPDIFGSMVVPKAEELVATAYRHGGKESAERFFLDGMTDAMGKLSAQAHPAFPTTIYYAFKQSDTSDLGTGNTGWETFLEAVLRAGFSITGTWPVRTEKEGRSIGNGTNALASSIVLVCRRRETNAQTISRRDFIRELKEELAEAVDVMIGGSDGVSPVAPVDLAQAVIGPGMGIFSKYSSVLEADGSPMSVHSALTLINRMLTEGADDFDSDTQFCLAWFDEKGWVAGEFGTADILAKAKGTSVDAVRKAGVVEATAGKVRLLKSSEYPTGWNAKDDNRTPVWEALHQLIRALQTEGESSAGVLLAGMPERAEPIRNLAYRLFTLCERKTWRDEARSYNELITSWSGIEAASHEKGHYGSQMSFEE